MAFLTDIPALDPDNPEFNYAAQFVMQTSRMVYVTGKAGTGKTTFLRYLQTVCNKRMAVLAPTGVAAVNAGGQTIHSFLNIKPSVYVPGDKRLRYKAPAGDADQTVITDHFKYQRAKLELIKNLELLVIDEISMVRCDLLDVVDQVLRHIRRRHYTPFGGVQVLLIGDTFQLPPIANQDDWDVLSKFYESPYFFSAHVMKLVNPVYIELKKIYRQSDPAFIDLLNRVRLNRLMPDDLRLLNSRYLHGFEPEEADDYIILASHNRMVIETNRRRLEEIDEELYTYEADVEGIFPEGSFPADRLLQLKAGAQVMMLRNDRQKRYFNGKIGHVETLDINSIRVRFPDDSVVDLVRDVWDNIRYTWNEKSKKVVEESVGTFTQFPVKLAWSITVHKSQGLTFDKVIADVAEAFTHGQVYVALSRCTSFQGLLLKTPMRSGSVITDRVVLEFATHETPGTVLLRELEKSKGKYYLHTAIGAWLNNEPALAAESLLLALEQKEAETGRILQLLDYAVNRFMLKSIALMKLGTHILSEEESMVFTKKMLKKRARELEKQLKNQIMAGSALVKLFDDLSEHEFAEAVVSRHQNMTETVTEKLRQLRKDKPYMPVTVK